MDIDTFVSQSIGTWRSQRSGHNLAFQHFEEVRSTIEISAVDPNSPEVLALCNTSNIEPALITSPFRMQWEGESDWDDDEEDSSLSGDCILVPVPDPDNSNSGQLLRSQGYAETIPAIGRYHFNEDIFTLITEYDRAAAEERIWFGTANVRFRVSLIRTASGTGVVTASFASEIRKLTES
ncbi:MAG: phycobiliprotein lyase [Spirulina sp. SIO3F2]|nr:phycobiliprotein lyase [Spirulina sp. SIO3F2]